MLIVPKIIIFHLQIRIVIFSSLILSLVIIIIIAIDRIQILELRLQVQSYSPAVTEEELTEYQESVEGLLAGGYDV